MIGNNINELISIAESQSDERLAQELNPQTETGMLGPTWLPAAELSFREKMRSGAQAQQQQNNGSIIDQLAQSAMMPQGMPPQGMPPQQQMMPQQMPQGMMPQQSMPQQMPPQQPMPPQMMAEGGMIGGSMSGIGLMENMMEEGGMQGLLQMLSNQRKDEDQDPVTQQEQMMEQNAMASGGMASGGIVNYANGGQITLDDLLNRTFQDYSDPTQADLYQKTFPRDTTYDTDPFGLDKYTKLREAKGELPLTDRQTLDNLIYESRNIQLDDKNFDGKRILNEPNYERTVYTSPETAREKFTNMQGEGFGWKHLPEATLDTLKNTAVGVGKGLAGTAAGTGVEPETANTNKTYAELLAEVGEIDSNAFGSTIMPFDRNLLPDTIKNIATGAAGLPEKIGTGYVDLVKKAYGINEPDTVNRKKSEGVELGPDFDPFIASDDSDKNITPPVDTTLPDLNPDAIKEVIAVTGDNTPIVSNPSTTITAGGNAGLTDDVYRGQKQVLSEQMEKILNPLRNKDGQMDRKWLAIAAGAFNAAQKGAPTLMAGLADLGGGVTEQLQSLDKEDQERAIALMTIYQKQMQLDETARGHDLTYQASVNKSIIDLQKSTDPLDQLKYLQTSAKDYASVNEKIATGLLDSSYKYTNDILHSGQGNVVAQIEYNNSLDKIKTKENQIIEQVEKEFNTDYDPNNAEHKTKADNLYQSWLSKNTGLDTIRKDYYSGRNQSDWVKSTLVL